MIKGTKAFNRLNPLSQTSLAGRFVPWIRLLRLHQPVGIYLLVWPVLIGLVDASMARGSALPEWWLAAIFALGAGLSRAAGCIANDLWDMDIDQQVTRTSNRPLGTGQIHPHAAFALMLILFAICAFIAWVIGPLLLLVAAFAVPCILLYPLAKRVTGHPQAVLALTFSLGIPMAYASQGLLFSYAWMPLMLANMCWIYAYDTVYAMADKPDDSKLGIGSSALSWGRYDWHAVALLQGFTLLLLLWWWQRPGGMLLLLALAITLAGFIWQQIYIRQRSIERCILAFRSNHWLQLGILTALVVEQL